MEYLIVALVAGYIGWKASSALNNSLHGEMLQELGVTEQQLRDLARRKGIELDIDGEPEEEPSEVRIAVRIEQHQGVLYCFSKEDDRFLAQGVDREELLTRIRDQIRGDADIRLIITSEDGAEFVT